jgi:hypothetical protein
MITGGVVEDREQYDPIFGIGGRKKSERFFSFPCFE